MSDVIISGNTSGTATLRAPDVAGSPILTLPTTSGTLIAGTNGITAEANGGTGTTTGYYSFKNRIINGAMMIDQRNAGASVTPNNNYTLDRWSCINTQASKFTLQRNAGSVTPPAGFINYLGITSSSAYSVISTDSFLVEQLIEGLNISDLGFGTANAQTITLSFWVRSSLTGTFGGSISNDVGNRTYGFNYTVSSANTWTQINITVPGDTTGTWLTTNSIGLRVRFGLGSGASFSGTAGSWSASNIVQPTGSVSVVGTNGATFYITGVQLEKGSTATSFDYRPYGTELALCQRYYYKLTSAAGGPFGSGYNNSTTSAAGMVVFPVTMRTAPTALEQSGTASNYRVLSPSVVTCSSVPIFDDTSASNARVVFTVASGLTAGQGNFVGAASGVTTYLAWSAEL